MDPISTTIFFVALAGGFIGVLGGLLSRNGKLIRTGGFIGLGLFAVAGLTFMVGTYVVPAAIGSGSGGSSAPPPAAASLNSYVTTASLPAGATWNTVTNTLTVDVVFNYTSNYWGIEAANTSTCNWSSGACHLTNYLLIPIKSARADAINQTFGFTYQIAQIPTALTIGSNPTAYSFVGYKAATSTASGQWQTFWGTGSSASQFPPQQAPTITTGVDQSVVGIQSFGSASNVLHVSMAGSNSTSAPTTFYSALTTYSTYTMSLSIQSSTPATILVNFVPLGEHA